MSVKFLHNIDLNKNQLQNAVIQPLAAAPSSPREGQIYWNTVDHLLYVYKVHDNGADWVPVGDVHTVEANSINVNGTVTAKLATATEDFPLLEVNESDDGTNTGGNGEDDHGVVDLRILETDGIFDGDSADAAVKEKAQRLVRSKVIFDYLHEYVTIAGTTNEIDVFSDDTTTYTTPASQLNPGITEGSIIKIGLPADVVIQNDAAVNPPSGETGTAGDASLTVKGVTILGRNGFPTDDIVTIYGDTTIGTSSNNVDLTVNGDTVLGVQGAGGSGGTNTVQIHGDTTIGDINNAKDLTVYGNLVVEGTTTTVNSETVTIADNFILLNADVDGTTVFQTNAGIEIQRNSGPDTDGVVGTDENVALRWNETTDKWQVTENGVDYYNINTGKDQVVASVGDGSANSFTVTHNFNTRDVIVQVFDNSTYETVMPDVTRGLNDVTITVANIAGNIPATNGLRVLVQRLY